MQYEETTKESPLKCSRWHDCPGHIQSCFCPKNLPKLRTQCIPPQQLPEYTFVFDKRGGDGQFVFDYFWGFVILVLVLFLSKKFFL